MDAVSIGSAVPVIGAAIGAAVGERLATGAFYTIGAGLTESVTTVCGFYGL